MSYAPAVVMIPLLSLFTIRRNTAWSNQFFTITKEHDDGLSASTKIIFFSFVWEASA
jgi:hypothetical protein